MKLAIVQNWDESFGYYDNEMNLVYGCNEHNLNKFISYLKKKKFITYSWERDEDGIEQTVFDFIKLFNYLNNVQTIVPFGDSKKFKINIIKKYNFSNRDFCSINISFEYFIKKCKKYYFQKLNYYKSPKSIIYRQRFGRFGFKFNNV